MNARYNSAGAYFARRFGCKTYKIALDGGMTCPNRDGALGTGGCKFCAGGSGDFAEPYDGDVEGMITRAIARVRHKGAEKYIAYFQSYTNTYAPPEKLEALFVPAASDERIAALSVGTRPDCLPPETVELLARVGRIKPVFVELGLQTSDDRTAAAFGRGYKTEVYDRAVGALARAGLEVVTHVILGLPGESAEDMLATVRHAADCGTAGIKLQLLHILRGTEYADMYERGLIPAMSLGEYIGVLCECVRALPPRVVVHRLTGDAPKRLLVAPLWSADKKRVINAIAAAFEARGVIQGEKCTEK